MTPKKALLIVVCIGLAWALADQWTKYLAVRDLTRLFPEDAGLLERLKLFYGTHGLYSYAKAPVEIIPGFWNHVYVQNPAGAFGFLGNAPEAVRRFLFTGVAFLASIGILWLSFYTYGKGMLFGQVSLGLVFGGAVGNLTDRLFHGYVIDFIDWYATINNKVYHWPAFNLADVGIVMGIGGAIYVMNFKPLPFEQSPGKSVEDKVDEGEKESEENAGSRTETA